MEEDIKKLLEIVVKRYIEEYIINLDLSDSTKNILKRQLRKTFLDEDLLYDLGTTAHKNSIPTSLVKEEIEELNKKEQELQNSISDEEREEYSDASISFELMDIEIRRSVLQELLGEE